MFSNASSDDHQTNFHVISNEMDSQTIKSNLSEHSNMLLNGCGNENRGLGYNFNMMNSDCSPSSSRQAKRKSGLRDSDYSNEETGYLRERGVCAVSEQIKRFRISTTPGEIRLQKDLIEIRDLQHVVLEYGDDPSNVILHYKYDSCALCPNRFSISIKRFYPHDAPVVVCLDTGFTSPFITASGLVIHRALLEDWSALSSLATIIDSVQQIRQVFQNSNLYLDAMETDSGSDMYHPFSHILPTWRATRSSLSNTPVGCVLNPTSSDGSQYGSRAATTLKRHISSCESVEMYEESSQFAVGHSDCCDVVWGESAHEDMLDQPA